MTNKELDLRVRQVEKATGFECLHYRELRKNASPESKAEALQRDAKWVMDWANERAREIDRLVDEVLS